MAFALTMLVLLGVMVILLLGVTMGAGGGGVMSDTRAGLTLTTARESSISALATADAGAELTLQWLHSQATPPAQSASFAPTLWGAALTGSPPRAILNYPNPTDTSQYFRVLIYPDAGNAATAQKKYMIESVGTSGAATQVVRMYVRLESLGYFAYFSNNASSLSCWTSGISAFDGPVHSNDADGTPTNLLWKSGGTPIFQDAAADALTVSGPQLNWRTGTPTSSGAPQTTSDWLAVASQGQAGVHTGVPVIPFPTASTQQQNAALGPASVPSAAGVFVPSQGGVTNGGIYIHGPAQSVTMAIEKGASGQSDVQDFFIQPPGLVLGLIAPVTEVQVNPEKNQTTVMVYALGLNFSTVLLTAGVSLLPVSSVTYTGTTDGVIYCDGVIGGTALAPLDGVSGTVADNWTSGTQILHTNSWTIATPGTGSLAIGSSVIYHTARQTGPGGQPLPESQDSNFTQKAGELGLISGTINLESQTLQGITLVPVEVDAALLAFSTCQAPLSNLLLPGTFVNMGDFVVGRDGSFGTLNLGGALQYGYTTTRHYDARLAATPPPAFPVTTNQYEVLSWQSFPGTLTGM